MSKRIEVKINGVVYLPENTSLTAEEISVNHRALVNDKLDELGTFYESDIEGAPNQLYLTRNGSTHASSNRFIIAGRIQEIVKDIAYYEGGWRATLGLTLNHDVNWKQVYDLLLKHEDFIKTGVRS